MSNNGMRFRGVLNCEATLKAYINYHADKRGEFYVNRNNLGYAIPGTISKNSLKVYEFQKL
jgi:hypothetical protein